MNMQPEEKWEKPSKDELKKRLTPKQYDVTQEEGTEPAFNNEYWDKKKQAEDLEKEGYGHYKYLFKN